MEQEHRRLAKTLIFYLLQCGVILHFFALSFILWIGVLVAKGYQIATVQHQFRELLNTKPSAQQLSDATDFRPIYDPATSANQQILELLALVESAKYDRAREMLRSRRVSAPRFAPDALSPVAELLSRHEAADRDGGREGPVPSDTGAASPNHTPNPVETDRQKLEDAIRELLFDQNRRPPGWLLKEAYQTVQPGLSRFQISLPPLIMFPKARV